jgi:exosortase K
LGPTAGLVEQISGIRFEKEAYTGFVNRTRQIIIAPSCAGVNFLIVAFCMAIFSGIHRMEPTIKKLLWLTGSIVSAYMLTVFVNALRIILSIYCYQMAVCTTWLTPERMHRLTGILIYFFFLCIFYSILDRGYFMYSRGIARKGQGILTSISPRSENIRLACAALIPFFWYGFITLAIPFLNSAYRENGARFIEHGWMVVCGCIVVMAIRLILRLMCKRVGKKLTTWKEKTV